jgi:hypothetical protein
MPVMAATPSGALIAFGSTDEAHVTLQPFAPDGAPSGPPNVIAVPRLLSVVALVRVDDALVLLVTTRALPGTIENAIEWVPLDISGHQTGESGRYAMLAEEGTVCRADVWTTPSGRTSWLFVHAVWAGEGDDGGDLEGAYIISFSHDEFGRLAMGGGLAAGTWQMGDAPCGPASLVYDGNDDGFVALFRTGAGMYQLARSSAAQMTEVRGLRGDAIAIALAGADVNVLMQRGRRRFTTTLDHDAHAGRSTSLARSAPLPAGFTDRLEIGWGAPTSAGDMVPHRQIENLLGEAIGGSFSYTGPTVWTGRGYLGADGGEALSVAPIPCGAPTTP